MHDSSHVSQPSSSVNKFDMAQKFSMGSFWGLSLVQGIFGVLFEALGILGGFDFCPIGSSLSLEIRSTPLGSLRAGNHGFPSAAISMTLLLPIFIGNKPKELPSFVIRHF